MTHFELPHPRRLSARVVVLLIALAGAALAWIATGAAADTQTTVTFNPALKQRFTAAGAEQQFVAPAAASAIHVVAIGGHGGPSAGAGGRDAKVTADVAVSGGQTLYVEVGDNGADGGAGGFNGGAQGAAGGGGASDVRTAPRASGPTPD